MLITLLTLLFIAINVIADGWDAGKPSHQTLYVDTLTSKTDSSSVNVADNFFVTGDVTTLGNVGIGTTSPSSKFDVKLDSNDNSAIIGRWVGVFPEDLPQRTLLLGPRPDSSCCVNLGFQLTDTIKGSMQYDDQNRFLWGSWYNNSWQSTMVLTASGNVGIGTVNPTRRLDVHGDIHIHMAPTDGGLMFGDDDPVNSKWHIGYWESSIAPPNGALIFTETGIADGILTLKAGGNIGIGTLNPQGLLHTYTPTERNFLFIDSDRNGDNPSTLQLWGKFSDGQKGKLQMIVRGNHPDSNYRDVFDFSIFDGTRWKEKMMRFGRDGTVSFLQGSVGIGTDAPSASSKLTVVGGITVSGSGSNIDGRAAMKLAMAGACMVAAGSGSAGRWVTEGASNIPCATICANTKPCADSQCLMGWSVWGMDSTTHYQYGNECTGDNSVNSGSPPLHMCCCYNSGCAVDLYR